MRVADVLANGHMGRLEWEQPVDSHLVGSNQTCRGRCPQPAFDR